MGAQAARNEPCPCGSGKKFKHCCIDKPPEPATTRWVLPVLGLLVAIAFGLFMGFRYNLLTGFAMGTGVAIIVGIVWAMRSPPPPTGKSGDAAAINFGK